MKIDIEKRILEKNIMVAHTIRERLESSHTFAINLVSSPGSGKTSLVERIIDYLHGKVTLSVIVGDVQTDLDASRIRRHEVPALQIETEGGCHLNAAQIEEALGKIPSSRLLIIENVGNLVCPANYDLGEDAKVVIVSPTEGEDKPLKYPIMFANSQAIIINKIDLVPYLDVSIDEIEKNARSINPALVVFKTSCKTGEGIKEFCEWLCENVKAKALNKAHGS
jgi:hydrogenase nickel incorporation protein HypB